MTLVTIGLLSYTPSVKAEQKNIKDSTEISFQVSLDSLKDIDSDLNQLKLRFDSLSSEYHSNLKFTNYAIENADSRVAWTIGLVSIIFSIIIFAGGFLIYLTTIQPAKKILDNFDHQVEEKFIAKERKEIFERINLAFRYLGTDKTKISENSKLIFENLPYPLKEEYRQEILRNIILINIEPTRFLSFFRIIEKYLFKENDFTNDQCAKYLVNNYQILHNDVIRYFSNNHENADKLIEILFPSILSWKETIWNHHRELCKVKFDQLFIFLEENNLLIQTYTDYVKYILSWEHMEAGGKKKPKTVELYKQEMINQIAKINQYDKTSYGYVKYLELYEREFEKLAEKFIKD